MSYNEKDKEFIVECQKRTKKNAFRNIHHWNVGRNNFFDKKLPKNSICAEIGVHTGKNAYRIYNLCNPKKLYLIDPWEELFKETSTDNFKESKKKDRLCVQLFTDKKDNIEIIQDFSVSASKRFDNNFFDWVYIDGDHRYKFVLLDLESWYPKVKSNGFIGGHDYDNRGGDVQRAVETFLKNHTDCNLVFKPPKHLWGLDGGDGHFDFLIKK